MRYDQYWEANDDRRKQVQTSPWVNYWDWPTFLVFLGFLLFAAMVIFSADELYWYLAECNSREEFCGVSQ